MQRMREYIEKPYLIFKIKSIKLRYLMAFIII